MIEPWLALIAVVALLVFREWLDWRKIQSIHKFSLDVLAKERGFLMASMEQKEGHVTRELDQARKQTLEANKLILAAKAGEANAHLVAQLQQRLASLEQIAQTSRSESQPTSPPRGEPPRSGIPGVKVKSGSPHMSMRGPAS